MALLRLSTLTALARHGVRGCSFAERVEIVQAAMCRTCPHAAAGVAVVDSRGDPIGPTWTSETVCVSWAEWVEVYKPHDKMNTLCLSAPGVAHRLSDAYRSRHELGIYGEFLERHRLGDVCRVAFPAGPGQLLVLGVGRRQGRAGFMAADRVILGAVAHALADGWRQERALAALSPRRLEVARLAASGLSAGQIAKELGVSSETARSHLKAAYKLLGASSRLDLLRLLR